MFVDICIAAFLCILTWRMGYVGVQVTLHPSGSHKGRSKKSVKKEFAIIAVMSTGLIAFQAYRSSKAYSDLKEAIKENENASVSLYRVQTHDPIEKIESGHPFQVDIAYIVSEHTAKNFRAYFDAKLDDGDPYSEVQNRKVFREFLKEAAPTSEQKGEDRGVDKGSYETTGILVADDQEKADIVSGTKTIYVMGEAWWNNPVGADFHTKTCEFMQLPKDTNGVIYRQAVSWHECHL
jgi:hypothetical protein